MGNIRLDLSIMFKLLLSGSVKLIVFLKSSWLIHSKSKVIASSMLDAVLFSCRLWKTFTFDVKLFKSQIKAKLITIDPVNIQMISLKLPVKTTFYLSREKFIALTRDNMIHMNKNCLWIHFQQCRPLYLLKKKRPW